MDMQRGDGFSKLNAGMAKACTAQCKQHAPCWIIQNRQGQCTVAACGSMAMQWLTHVSAVVHDAPSVRGPQQAPGCTAACRQPCLLVLRAASSMVALYGTAVGVRGPHVSPFAFNPAGVVDLLMQQNAQLQEQRSLLESKVQEVKGHTQKVHDSYSEAVNSIAANLTCETSSSMPGLLGASKRQRTETPPASPATAAAAAAAGSPAAAAHHHRQQHSPHQLAPPSYSQPALSFASQLPLTQGPASGSLAAAAGSGGLVGASAGSGGGRHQQMRRAQGRQPSSEERLKQRLLLGQRRLRQDWDSWLRPLLDAEDVATVQQLVAARQQMAAPASGGGRTDMRQHGQLQTQVPAGLDVAAGTQEAAAADNLPQGAAAGGHAAAAAASAAVAGTQQQPGLAVDGGLPHDDATAGSEAGDDDDEPGPVVVVHRTRGRGRAAGGALTGFRRR